MTINLQDLAKPFPREAVSWRAQTLTKAGDKALALAYIDARDVMQRLDEVCGVDGWEDSYVETPRGRVIATIRIRINDQWVSKSDGAGDTAVEGEKGGISDAFKRAAVKWGVGRYLYEIDAPWVPCETYEAGGKKHWKAWKGDPWDFVRGNASKAAPASKADSRDTYDRLSKANRDLQSEEDFNRFWSARNVREAFEALPNDWRQSLVDERNDKAAELAERAAVQDASDYVPPKFEDQPVPN